MTADHSVDEGRTYWLLINCKGVLRKVEWKSNKHSFAELQAKVRSLFQIDAKAILNFEYSDGEGERYLVAMSSDEELAALFNSRVSNGNTIDIRVTVVRRGKKGLLGKVRIAKRNAILGVRALPGAVSSAAFYASRSLAPICHSTHQFVHAARATTIPWRKIAVPCLILLFGLMFAHYRCNHHTIAKHPHVTILAANYGTSDVTKKVQSYYNTHGVLLSHNSLFGDPAYGFAKNLQVVYQTYNPFTNTNEIFSESFPESNENIYKLTWPKEKCAHPSEARVNGRNIKILGASYDSVSATCQAQTLLVTGSFTQSYKPNLANKVSADHFTSAVRSGNQQGLFTVAYLSDGKLQVSHFREGATVYF